MRRPRKGLTLVDLMVSLAILAIVLSSVYYVFALQRKTVAAASEARDLSVQGLILLDRISRDLAGAWLPEDPNQNAGVMYSFKGGVNQLNFISTASLSPTQALGPSLVEVQYRIAQYLEEEDEDDIGPDRPENLLYLIRRQDDEPDDEPEGGGREIVLTENLVSLEFMYLNENGEEQDYWDLKKSKGGLPRSVRITMILSMIQGQEEAFSTRVDLPIRWSNFPKIKNSFSLSGGLN